MERPTAKMAGVGVCRGETQVSAPNCTFCRSRVNTVENAAFLGFLGGCPAGCGSEIQAGTGFALIIAIDNPGQF